MEFPRFGGTQTQHPDSFKCSLGGSARSYRPEHTAIFPKRLDFSKSFLCCSPRLYRRKHVFTPQICRHCCSPQVIGWNLSLRRRLSPSLFPPWYKVECLLTPEICRRRCSPPCCRVEFLLTPEICSRCCSPRLWAESLLSAITSCSCCPPPVKLRPPLLQLLKPICGPSGSLQALCMAFTTNRGGGAFFAKGGGSCSAQHYKASGKY